MIITAHKGQDNERIEFDITSDEIYFEFERDLESINSILSGLNNVACFLKGIPDSKIGEMSSGQRIAIVEFLSKQIKRYEAKRYDEKNKQDQS